MGSPLGVLFASFFMGSIESTTIKKLHPSPYARYVDDIFECINNLNELRHSNNSCAMLPDSTSLIYEESKEGYFPFLDVLITAQESGSTTSVYIKDTNKGLSLDANSECPRQCLQ